MKNKFCPRFWHFLCIAHNGDVFGCCHWQPAVLGNIYEDTLENIWNSETVKKYRKHSLDGTLPCLADCALLTDGLSSSIMPSRKSLVADYADLKTLIVSFGQGCNLRCIMCDKDQAQGVPLNPDILRKSVKFDHIESVEISGGEPLFIKEALSFFDFLISKKIKVSFFTNGSIMNDLLAEKIALNCSVITFSLNAATKETHEAVNRGSRWEVVLENVKKVDFFREKHKTGLVLNGHMTLVIKNLPEIPKFIKNYKKFGFDQADFGFDEKTVPAFLKKFPQSKKRLRAVIRQTLKSADLSEVHAYALESLGLR